MNEMEHIVKEFIKEGQHNLDRFAIDLAKLGKDPTSQERLDSVFRTIHNMKGASGFLEFSKLAVVARAGEGLLNRMRSGDIVINPQITSELLSMVDCIRQMLTYIDRTGIEGDVDCAALVETLVRLQDNRQTGEVTSVSSNFVDHTSVSSQAKAVTPNGSSAMQALVVDDSHTMRIILCTHLRKLGFEVTEAGNGHEAFDRLAEKTEFDLILVDCDLPQMNGIALIHAIRAKPSYTKLPVVLATTHVQSADIATAMAAGADQHIMKPFDSEMIREKLKLLGVLID